MTQEIWLIGIGTGSLSHLTLEGQQAIRDASTILVPRKSDEKSALVALRDRLIADAGTDAEILYFDYPLRDPALPYETRVSRWHDEIAARWQDAMDRAAQPGPVALLVWGDPSLYDSTLRIAGRLSPGPNIRVVPGITSIQALTAAHAIPLNTVNGPVHITTGRRLRDHGWPTGEETVLVMLDGDCSFDRLMDDDLQIWWGAYLGSDDQILCAGRLSDVSERIKELRRAARARHGWIMDTYLLRKEAQSP